MVSQMLQSFRNRKSRLQQNIEQYSTNNIHFNDEKHYDVFYFKDRDELNKLMEELNEMKMYDRQSTWYGNMAHCVTILHARSINKIVESRKSRTEDVQRKRKGKQRRHRPTPSKYPIISVLPAQLTDSDSHIIGAYEDYSTSLIDLNEYLEGNGNMFESDQHGVFTLFLSVRVTRLEEKIVRRLFLHELIEALISTTVDFDYNHNPGHEADTYINIAMYSKDAQQTGLEMLPFRCKSGEAGSNETATGYRGYVNIQTTLSELLNFQKYLSRIDSLLIDAVIFANDANFLGAGSNYKLQFTTEKMLEIGSVSGNRCIDPGELEKALKYSDRNNDKEVVMEIEKQVELSVRRLLFMLNAFGVSFDIPVKYVRYKETFRRSQHLFKLSRNIQGAHLIGKREMSTFQSYSRRVKAVEKDGFKVQTINFIYWFIFSVAVAISLSYGFLRKSKATWEDLFQTIVALLTVFITAFTTMILNTTYKGEKLGDILTNVRKIDTQEEFQMKEWKQPSDIIEVLRLNHDSPLFLGGGVNTSFIPGLATNAGLQARHPMSFSNLEAIGYGLFETAEGILYMIDHCQNVYRAHVIDNYEEAVEYKKFDENTENHYVRIAGEHSYSQWRTNQPSEVRRTSIPNSYSNTSLNEHTGNQATESTTSPVGEEPSSYVAFQMEEDEPGDGVDTSRPSLNESSTQPDADSSPPATDDKLTRTDEDKIPRLMRLTLYFTFLNQKIDKRFSLDQYTNCTYGNSSCCAYVKDSDSDRDGPIALSRVLPYGARKRPVGVIKRYYQYNVSWLEIENRNLFRMDVGRRNIRTRKRSPGPTQH